MRRRSVLAGLTGLGALAWLGPDLAWASPADSPRLVVVLLRGGLDGLAAVPAVGDPHFSSARAGLVAAGGRRLDDTFALHPALQPLGGAYDRGELLVVHATAPPYHDRSHFDAQNVLENGTPVPFGARSGWLARALGATGSGVPALAVGRSVPLVLQGPTRAASAEVLRRRRRDPDFLDRVRALYAHDAALGSALDEGRAMQAKLARQPRPESGDVAGRTATVLAGLLGSVDGPRVGVLELGGYDTHARQAAGLTRRLESLSTALEAFRVASSPAAWARTAVVVLTEFGRTVAPNGTGGTDHGVGGVALLFGGAVAGGRVLTDWPGLAPAQRLDGRDLRPTTDLRAVLASVLHDHLRVPQGAMNEVFPGLAWSAGLPSVIRDPGSLPGGARQD